MAKYNEPWTVRLEAIDDALVIRDSELNVVTATAFPDWIPETRKRYERIVACVNACKGMPSDLLNGTSKRYGAHTIPEFNVIAAQMAQAALLIEALLDGSQTDATVVERARDAIRGLWKGAAFLRKGKNEESTGE